MAKHLRAGGYQTAVIGKWHLGEGKDHQPAGFELVRASGQGDYFDPQMIEMGERRDKWLCPRLPIASPKAGSRTVTGIAPFPDVPPQGPASSGSLIRIRAIYAEAIPLPETFDDDYRNRAGAAAAANAHQVRHDLC